MAILRPIIPFNLIIDIDVGLIKMIDKKYHNTDVFYTGMLSAPVKPLIYNLVNRPISNPLYVIMQDKEDIDTMDLLYDQFIEEEYENIVGNSVTTDLFGALKLFMKNDAIVPTILCSNDIEADTVSKIDFDGKKVPIVTGTLEENHNIFDPIYVKDFKSILPIVNNIVGKNIYVANYSFNYEKDKSTLLKDIMIGLDTDVVKTIEVYHIDNSFIAKG